jgi:hypothetical protein
MPSGLRIPRRALTVPVLRDLAGPSDTFTDTDGVAITAHTPTGPNAASGWDAPAGGFTIATNAVEETTTGVTNRAVINANLASSQMDSEAEFTLDDLTTESVTPGVIGRASGTTAIEFYYQKGFGRFGLRDSVTTVTLTEALPGTNFKLRLVVRNSGCYGYCNGVLKLSLPTNLLDTQLRAGFYVGNFTAAAGKCRVDNFKSQAYP